MAVTITVAELSAALRLDDSTEEVAEVTRLLGFATETLSRHLGDAYNSVPADVINEAVVRIAGYLFDQPYASRGLAVGNALRNSGAQQAVLPWRIHRAGSTEEAAAAAADAGTATNPVVSVVVDETNGTLAVTLADGTTTSYTLPAGVPGSGGVDQTARDAAASAHSAADAAQTTASAASTLATTNAATLATVLSNLAEGGRLILRTEAQNIAMDSPDAEPGDIVATLVSGVLTFYRRLNTDTNPYWTLVGSVTGGGGGGLTTGAVNTLIASWWSGHPSVNIAQLPVALPLYITDPLGHPDIPYSAMDGTLEPWTVKTTADPKPLIPDDRLDQNRLIPAADPTADRLKIPQINPSGIGVRLIDLPTGGDAIRVWRTEFVEGESQFGTAGKVFIRLRYIETYNAAGVLQSTVDAGNGFLAADGTRVLAQGQALDMKALLTDETIDALMSLVSAAPAASSATSGLWYGVGDGTVVDSVQFRKRIPTATRTTVRIERCPNRSDGGANGYNSVDDINLGMDTGGSLSPPTDAILSAVEVWLTHGGNYYFEVIVPQASPINGATGVFMSYGTDPDNLTQVFLARDASYDTDNRRRYSSTSVDRSREWRWGYETLVEFRNSANANPATLATTEVMETVADHDYVDQEVHVVGRDIDAVDARVAELEARSATAFSATLIASGAPDATRQYRNFSASEAQAFIDGWTNATYSRFMVAVEWATGAHRNISYMGPVLRIGDLATDDNETRFHLELANFFADPDADVRLSVNNGTTKSLAIDGGAAGVFPTGSTIKLYGLVGS